jgi:hypothetical protein
MPIQEPGNAGGFAPATRRTGEGRAGEVDISRFVVQEPRNQESEEEHELWSKMVEACYQKDI